MGDTDTEEYINIPDNNLVVDFDRLVEIEPAVLAIYDMPVGKEEGLQIYNEGQRLLKLVRQELGSDFKVIDCLEWIYPEKGRLDE